MVMKDARFQRMSDEYQAVRNVQDSMMDTLDEILPAMARAIEENRQAILQANSKLDAIIAHFDVEYRPIGFNPEKPE